jgi:hypothetical protein
VHVDGLRRFKRVPVTLAAVAVLAPTVLGATSAHASVSSPATPTYTCDAVTVTGPGGAVIPGTEAIEGTGNCVPANGAPASGAELNNVNIVQRPDGITYSCYGWYGGVTYADTPASVQSYACYVSS